MRQAQPSSFEAWKQPEIYRDWFLLRCSITLEPGWGGTIKGSKLMFATTTFLVTLSALVAFKIAACIGVDSGHFDDLPRPSQID